MNTQTQSQSIVIHIMGKDYHVVCREDEQETLLDSAQKLDAQMHHIRDTGKVSGLDKIAIMAALNLTHELSTTQKKNRTPMGNIVPKLANLRHKIESVLEKYSI